MTAAKPRFVAPVDASAAVDARTALARTHAGLQTLTRAEHDTLNLARPVTDPPMRCPDLPTPDRPASIIDLYTGHLRDDET